ncbi:MAG TPA: hypothetical protein VIP70_07440 [Nitrososphaeraceae archaeon]
MAITSGDRYSALESFTINTREIHQHGNQQRDKEPWYAVGERVRLRPSGESRGHHLSIWTGEVMTTGVISSV